MRSKSLFVIAIFVVAIVSFQWRRGVAILYGYSASQCQLHAACGHFLAIDCDRAADGPYDYVNAWTWETVSRCGGACMGGQCSNCPPVAWTCAP